VAAHIYMIKRKTKFRRENEDLRIMTINNWTKFILDGVKWKEIVEARTFKH